MPNLYRVILPVTDIAEAERFYSRLFAMPGERVSPGRHYFKCGGTILACYDPQADGDPEEARPNFGHLYFAVADLEAMHARAKEAGCSQLDDKIETWPWGERSFYAVDPFGNPLCFVDEKTLFTGN